MEYLPLSAFAVLHVLHVALIAVCGGFCGLDLHCGVGACMGLFAILEAAGAFGGWGWWLWRVYGFCVFFFGSLLRCGELACRMCCR
jgi:hypothetical protein